MCCLINSSRCKCFYTRPSYRKRKSSDSAEFSVRPNVSVKGVDYPSTSSEAPAMLVPTLVPARSVREAIQEVKMVQVRLSPPLNSYHSLSCLLQETSLSTAPSFNKISERYSNLVISAFICAVPSLFSICLERKGNAYTSIYAPYSMAIDSYSCKT